MARPCLQPRRAAVLPGATELPGTAQCRAPAGVHRKATARWPYRTYFWEAWDGPPRTASGGRPGGGRRRAAKRGGEPAAAPASACGGWGPTGRLLRARTAPPPTAVKTQADSTVPFRAATGASRRCTTARAHYRWRRVFRARPAPPPPPYPPSSPAAVAAEGALPRGAGHSRLWKGERAWRRVGQVPKMQRGFEARRPPCGLHRGEGGAAQARAERTGGCQWPPLIGPLKSRRRRAVAGAGAQRPGVAWGRRPGSRAPARGPPTLPFLLHTLPPHGG